MPLGYSREPQPIRCPDDRDIVKNSDDCLQTPNAAPLRRVLAAQPLEFLNEAFVICDLSFVIMRLGGGLTHDEPGREHSSLHAAAAAKPLQH